MGNFWFQLLALFPLAAISSAIGYCFIYAIYYLATYDFNITVQINFFGFVGDANGLGIVILLIGSTILMAVMWLIDFKIRAIDDWGWRVFDFILLPIRAYLQFISIIMSVVAVFSSGIESGREFSDDSFGASLCSILFNFVPDGSFSFRMPRRSRRNKYSYVHSNSYQTIDERKKEIKQKRKEERKKEREKVKKRFGEEGIKSRNILMQVFALLPATAVLCFLSVYIITQIMGTPIIPIPKDSIWEVLAPILCGIGILFFAMLVAQLKGHEPAGDYWDKYFRFKKDGAYRDEEQDYDPEVDDLELTDKSTGKKWKKVRGGWTTYIRPITLFCILFSPVLVGFQFVSLLIAIFTNPYKGRLFSWYGEIDWDYCSLKVLQKIMHFFFGFVILDY